MAILGSTGLVQLVTDIKNWVLGKIPTKVSDLTNDSGFLTTHNPIDSALSSTSTNAVQNNVINTALSGKAADTAVVHNTGNETVSGTKSFNSDLNLNYASTDVDDIVNSVAGSATLDNFVHMTGNETVNGIKSFPDGIITNVTGSATSATSDSLGNVISSTYGKLDAANTWAESNAYNRMVLLNSSSDVAEQFKQKLPKDVSVSSDALVRFNTLTDSEDHNVVVEALGHWASYVSKSITLQYKNDSTKQGTIDFRLDSDGYGVFYPQSPFECNLGNATNQWKSVYARSYYYNGTAWGLDQINVWTNRNILESWGFTIRENSIADSTPPSSDVGRSLIEVWNGSSTYWGGFGYRWCANGNSELVISLSNWNSNVQGYWEYKIGVNKAFNDLYFAPPHNLVNLGTSTSKWKTLNGVNPGALSFPNPNWDSIVDFSTALNDITKVAATASKFSWTAAVTGWMTIAWNTRNLTPPHRVAVYSTLSNHDGDSRYPIFATSFATSTPDWYLFSSFPVVEGVKYWFETSFSNTTDGIVYHAYILPCLGNV